MNENTYNVYSDLLNQCDKEMDKIYHYYALRHNLSDASLWLLYALYYSQNDVTQSDICNCWFLNRQTINTALNILKRQGIIELSPIIGNNKSKKIVFTSAGKTLADKIILPLKQAENKVFASFSDEENNLFIKMSQKRCSLLQHFLELK